MKLISRIVEYSNEKYRQENFKTIEGLLYNVTINQNIRLVYKGRNIECKVIDINDSVYDDVIYRYIEVVLINN